MRHRPVPSIFLNLLQLSQILVLSSFCFADPADPVASVNTRPVSDATEVVRESVAVDLADSIKVFPVSADVPVQRVLVGGGSGSIAAAGTESVGKLVYSNTFGRAAVQFLHEYTIADDLELLAPYGCTLDRFSFQITGRANPVGESGAYRADFGLYDSCPGAGGTIIPGTHGFVEITPEQADEIHQVEFVIPDNQTITLGSSVWLGIKFNRENCGVLVGALPVKGFSDDIVDYSGSWRNRCNSSFGGNPNYINYYYANFNVEVYIRGDCPDAFPAYHNARDSGDGLNPGINVWIADDLWLETESCEMVGYEVGIRDVGFYTFEMLTDNDGLPGTAVEGTRKFIINNESGTFRHQMFTFDPPITIDKNVWMASRVGNNVGGWVLTGRDASWGRTGKYFFVKNTSDQWVRQSPPIPNHGGFYVNIICAGKPPVGACCDMYTKACDGGHDDGKTCRSNEDCKHPGTCEAVCREVPRMNCSFPPRGFNGQPAWMEGSVCDPDPFPFPCGASACCKPNDTCENLTENECNAVEPVEIPRIWRFGQYCGEKLQECPFSACVRREGDCVVAHPEPGCDNSWCCVDVCNADPYCCEVEWDRQCVTDAALYCTLPPANDECFGPREGHGAQLVNADSNTLSDGVHSTTNETDPGFCCFLEAPNAHAQDTVWYKFRAIHQYANISTISADNVGGDSLLQLFSVGDDANDDTACQSLIPIACDDDGLHYQDGPALSEIVVDDLIPGEVYYVLVANKGYGRSYRLVIDSPGPYRSIPENNQCQDATTINNGVFDIDIQGLRRATVDCPIEECETIIPQDIWYEYTATCSGRMVFTPCFDGFRPDVVVMYEGCDCPSNSEDIVECNIAAVSQYCDRNDLIELSTTEGQCYKIRMGTSWVESADNQVVGYYSSAHIDCIQCDPGEVAWVDPPSEVVDARRPEPYTPCDENEGCAGVPWYQREGINELVVTAPRVTHLECWHVEQTNINPDLHPRACCENKEIRDVAVKEGNSKDINLYYKLQSGEATTVSYSDDAGGVQSARFVALPGDVDGNLTVCSNDVQELIDIVKGDKQPVWDLYSADIDHSGSIHSADILQLIDLMNGAGAYKPWLSATVSADEAQCP